VVWVIVSCPIVTLTPVDEAVRDDTAAANREQQPLSSAEQKG